MPRLISLTRRAFLCALVLGFPAVVAALTGAGQVCRWNQLEIDGPSARHSHAMAYDVQRDLVAETGPSPRMGHAMFYDSRRGAVILFGGNDGAPPERHMGVGRPGMETPFHIRSLPSFKACSSLRFRSWSGGSLWRHSKRAGRYLGVGRQLLENRRCFRA